MKTSKTLILLLALIVAEITHAQSVDGISGASQQISKNQTMKGETVICRGKEAHTAGKMLAIGKKAPDFKAVNGELAEVSLSDYRGKRVILNIFPSLDTPTCAVSVRQFNARASSLDNTVVLCLSMDLPFAQSRFCSVEGLENVVPLSLFRNHGFFDKYGLQLADGHLEGLAARAVIVVDEQGKIIYTQLVEDISHEPDYDAALKALGES